jgi:hypothetical protein
MNNYRNIDEWIKKNPDKCALKHEE